MTTPVEIKSSNYTFTENRGRPKLDNPFTSVIEVSWANRDPETKQGTVLEVTIKNSKELSKSGQPANVVTTMGQIRDAAAEKNLGARMQCVVTDAKGKPKADGAYTTIYFAAKERTKRTRKNGNS